jgi:hypothetical protein
MISNSALTLVASGLFSLLVAAVSGGIAFWTARSNARGELNKIQLQARGELDKIQLQVDAQQAVLEEAKITELRQSYLTPLRYYAQTLSLRLNELKIKFQSAENDKVRAWFKTVKDHVKRDKLLDHYEAWCYYEGIFAVSTLYYTCSYFYYARSVRFHRPFAESRPVYSEKLEALLADIAEAFGRRGSDTGIWDTAQELIGERFAENNSPMTYAEMCSEHEAEEPFRRAPFFRPLDFYSRKLDIGKAEQIKASLDALVNFLDSHDPNSTDFSPLHSA